MIDIFTPLAITHFLKTYGYLGIFSFVFAESGLFFGFFLPGDSLLVTAGILAGAGVFSPLFLFSGVIISAALGDSFGYFFGRVLYQKIKHAKHFRIQEKNIKKAEDFYEKYGAKAIILARFVPVVRTFVPILAGMSHMKYEKFLKYNIIGAFLWGGGVTLLGYFLGSRVPHIEDYIFECILFIIVLSLLPIFFEILVAKKKSE